jgi:hypothetical protein
VKPVETFRREKARYRVRPAFDQDTAKPAFCQGGDDERWRNLSLACWQAYDFDIRG